jgi:hypothetical protein
MSTYDVPGYNPANADTLRALCWAEHEDGSMILVESTENGRVIYSIFDLSGKNKIPPTPIIEFRDAMPEKGFKKIFSWNPKKQGSEKWLWKDKTPFPWDRIIEENSKDGVRHVNVEDQLNAALRIAKARNLINEGKTVSIDKIKSFIDTIGEKGKTIKDKIQRAIHELGI